MVTVVVMGTIFILCCLAGATMLFLTTNVFDTLAGGAWEIPLICVAVCVVSLLAGKWLMRCAEQAGYHEVMPRIMITSIVVPAVIVTAAAFRALTGVVDWARNLMTSADPALLAMILAATCALAAVGASFMYTATSRATDRETVGF